MLAGWRATAGSRAAGDALDATRPSARTFLILLTVLSTLGFQLWRSLFNNFAVEEAGIDGAGMGLIQSVREIPGFLALLVIYLTVVIREQSIAILSVAVLGLGVALVGLFPTLGGLLATTLIFSFGFHYFETVNQSMTLQFVPTGEAAQFLGRVRAWGAFGSIVAVGAAFLLTQLLGYRSLFMLGGGGVALAALATLAVFPRYEAPLPQRSRMVFRRRYWLFYVLTFLSGARRQIFVAFAVFLMVKNFGFTVREIALLYLANNVITLFTAPLIGKMVHRFGERWVITLEYSGLILIFLGYAWTTSKVVLVALYVIDHIFFNMSIAIKTYFQKIADPADIAPSMAVAFTINHIAAVVIPAVGGLIWLANYQWTFYGGAILALASLACAQRVTTAAGTSAPPVAPPDPIHSVAATPVIADNGRATSKPPISPRGAA